MTQATTLPTPSPAFIAPEPFSRRVERLERIAGLTVAELLVSAVGAAKIDLDDLDRVAVYENGVDLEELLGSREAVLDYVPAAGATLNLAVEPLGGGGGGNGNKALQTVLTIAVIALSFYVGGGAATPALLDSLLVRTALAATVNVVGQMAISAAFGQNGAGGLAEANDRRALEGASNRFRPREPFPLQLGAAVVGADLAAAPYTQNIGDDTFLHVALAWHYGPAALSELKIGGTLIGDYPAEDIQVQHFLTPGPRTSFLYPGRVIQENKSDELDQRGGGTWEVDTLVANAERGEVDITFPNGIKYNADSGKVRDEEVSGRVEIAVVGTEAWIAPALDGAGVIGAGSWRVVARTNDAVRRTFGFALPDKTKLYKVRVKSFDHQGEFPSDDRTTGAYWTALRSIERRAPIVDETLAVTFMRIRSSDDLNGNLPTVTARIEPIVPVWNGDAWVEAPSSNAAALARWLLTGPAAAIPLRTDQVDDSFIAGFELVEAQGWEGAVSVTSEASQADVLRRLGRLGRFATYWSGRKLCLVTDWEKPAPRQVFAGRNAQGYRYRRMFPGPIHAVIVEFNNGEDESGSDEVVVYADGFTPANSELFETLRLDFSCDLDRAYREGRVFLAKRELQVEVHEWTAGADSIATTYGDRVLARHVSTLYGLADGRVDYRHWTGELVSGVRLDQAVEMQAGETYAIDVRRSDGVIRGIPVVAVAGTHRSLTFAAPLAADDAPMKGDLVVFGRTALVTEDVEIVDVEPAGGMTATFRALRYLAPEIMAAETGPVPALTSGITPRAVAPVPRITGSTGSPDGVTVAFEVDPVRGSLLASTAVRWRRNAVSGDPVSPWSALPPLSPTERLARTPPITDAASAPDAEDAAYAIDVELRTVLRNGSVSAPAYAIGVLVSRFVPPPTGLLCAGVTRTSTVDQSSYPALYVIADEITAGLAQDMVVEVRPFGGGPLAWTSAGQPLPSPLPRGDLLNVSGGQTYDVRARWRFSDNWSSAWFVYPTPVLIPSGQTATDTTHVGGRPIGDIPALDTTPPGVPTAVNLSSTSVTNSAGNPYARISATWTAPSDSDLAGFDVEVTESGFTVIDRARANAWSREGLAGRSYSIRVRAVDLAGNVSGWTVSQSVTGAGDTTAPAAPTGFTVNASLGALFLAWTNATAGDLASVEVWESTGSNSASATRIATVAAQSGAAGSYTRGGLSAGNTRFYWLKSVDTSGNVSGFSSPATGTIPSVPVTDLDTTPPAIPTGLSLASSTGPHPATGQPVPRVVATWTPPADSDLAGFEIEWTEGSNAPVIRRVGGARDAIEPALPGVTYSARVRAVDRAGNASAFTSSASLAAATDTTPPGTPTSVSLTFSVTSAFLRWAAPTDADVAAVEIYSNSTNNSGTSVLEARVPAQAGFANGWTKGGLTTGQVVYFWLRAIDYSGNRSGYSAVVSGSLPSIQVTDFASAIRPVELMTQVQRLAASPTLGRQVFDTTLLRLFRGTGTGWDSTVPAVDITGQITETQITPGSISTPLLAAGAVTTAKITAGAITANEIAANTITAGQIAAGAINTTQLAAGAITAEKIGADQITATHISAGAVTTDELAAGAVTALKIAAGTITATQIAANTITALQIAANSVDASRLSIGARGVTFDRLNFSTSGNTATWTNGRVSYVDDSGVGVAFDVTGGSYAYTATGGDCTFIYWTKGAASLSTTKLPGVAMASDALIVATYYGAGLLTATFGRTIIDGDYIKTGSILAGNIAAGAITTAKLAAGAVTANEISAGTITSTQIAAGTITSDRIQAGTITGDRINVSTALPATVTIGATGVQIGTVETRAGDPLARANALGTTTLGAGLVTISGLTTLNDWRQAGDTTRIAGGSVSANTIDVNKLKIGARGVTFDRLNFTTSGNTLSWNNGRVAYVDDSGSPLAFDVSGGSYAYSASGGDVTYIYWTKGATSLSTTKNGAIALASDALIVATYYGGNTVTATFGRTVIDGDYIKTGSIVAGNIAAGAITTAKIAAGAITTTEIAAGAVTATKITVSDLAAISAALGTVTTGLLQNSVSTFGVNATLGVLVNFTGTYMKVIGSGFGSSSDLMEWWGPKPSGATLSDPKLSTLTKTNGAWAFATDGQIYYGSAPLNPGGGGGDLTVTTNLQQTVGGSGGYPGVDSASYVSVVAGILTGVVSGQLIDCSVELNPVTTSTGTAFNGMARLVEVATGNVVAGPVAVSAAHNDFLFVGLAGAATYTGTTQYQLQMIKSSGGNLNAGSSSAWSFSRYVTATSGLAGLMSSADKSKLDAIPSGGGGGVTLATTAPATVATANAVGTGTTAARSDHTHAHGNQAGGALHAVATTSVDGFMSAADKATLNAKTQADLPNTLVYRDASANASFGAVFTTGGFYVNGAGVYHPANLPPTVTTTTAGLMAAASLVKLNGIATGATANSADSTLLNRANHTGSQAISTVTNLQSSLDGKSGTSHSHALLDSATSGTTGNTLVRRDSGGNAALIACYANAYYIGSREIATNGGNFGFNVSLYAPSFVPTSDLTLKQNVEDVDGAAAFSRILQVQPITFDWIDGGESDRGFGAQTLRDIDALYVRGGGPKMRTRQVEAAGPVLPGRMRPLGEIEELVVDPDTGEHETNPLGLNTTAILADAVAAIRVLAQRDIDRQAEINAISAELANLRDELAAIKAA